MTKDSPFSTDEWVPNPFTDGSSRRPYGLILLEKCSLPKLYRLNRHFYLKSKRSKAEYMKRGHVISTRSVLEYIKKQEEELGISDLPIAQRYKITIDLILEYFENEYEKLYQELKVVTYIAKEYVGLARELPDKKVRHFDIEELISLETLKHIPKKEVPESLIRDILKDFNLPENQIVKKSIGFSVDLKNE